jgi:hypothetical protein
LGVTASKQNLVVGDTVRWVAVVTDSLGRTLSDEPVTWTSADRTISSVDSRGLVTGTGVGSTNIIITVASKPSLSTTIIVHVSAPPPPIPQRPAGSLLAIGSTTVQQFGEPLTLSTLKVIDTAKVGTDFRVGVLHTQGADTQTYSRDQYPHLAVIAECPNGEAYAISYADSDHPTLLLRVSVQTAFVTLVGTVFVGPGLPASMTCDASNSLIVAANFGSIGSLYRVNRLTGTSTLLYQPLTSAGFLGIAVSPTGILYAAMEDQILTAGPAPYIQSLVTFNATTGAITSSIPAARGSMPRGPTLVFRGNRLLGLSFDISLREIDPATATTTTIKAVSVP